jgi:glycosyltransferase involved in cell wall biosynthesis
MNRKQLVVVAQSHQPHGHYVQYNQVISLEAHRQGWPCRILVPEDQAAPTNSPVVNYQAVLPVYHDGKSKFSLLAYLFRLASRLRSVIRPGDILFWQLPSSTTILVSCLLAVFFPKSISQVVLHNVPPRKPSLTVFFFMEQAARLAVKATTFLRLPIRFYGCSHRMVEQYRANGWPMSGKLLTYSHSGECSPPRPGGTTHFAYLGPPRHTDEKGLAWLIDTVFSLKAELEQGLMTWTIQIGPPPADFYQAVESVNRLRLAELPNVRLVDHFLNELEYGQVLNDCHFVVVPYNPSFYSGAPSGIVNESLASGRPVVGTRDTWVEEVILQNQCGLVCTNGDREDLRNVLLQATRQRDDLCLKAWNNRQAWRKEHDIERFVGEIVNG